jgi:hypothetical protein
MKIQLPFKADDSAFGGMIREDTTHVSLDIAHFRCTLYLVELQWSVLEDGSRADRVN